MRRDKKFENAIDEVFGDIIEKRLEDGIKNKSEEIATNLIKKKMPAEDIIDVTSVPIKRLRELAKSIGVALI